MNHNGPQRKQHLAWLSNQNERKRETTENVSKPQHFRNLDAEL
jgi:hypothetical protein